MQNKRPKIAISIGDINGIGLEIALQSHKTICKLCQPYYFIHKSLLNQALKRLKLKKPKRFHCVEFSNAEKMEFLKDKNKDSSHFKANLGCKFDEKFAIEAGQIDAKSGAYSFASFKFACEFVKMGFAKALITLPIHKKAWSEADIAYKGHTQALSEFFKRQAIMMLGCKKLFVGLFTEHIPLSEVSTKIQVPALCEFFIAFYAQTHFKNIGVLAFNPHASDFGTIGGEEESRIIKALRISNLYLSFVNSALQKQKSVLKACNLDSKEALLAHLIENERLESDFKNKISATAPKNANSAHKFKEKSQTSEFLNQNLAQKLEKELKIQHFYQPNPLVADSAFTKNALKHCNRLVSMSHDLALTPLKALYFDKSVNVSLNLPIIRTSVDHGTAFDKAYTRAKISTKSYKEAVKTALRLIKAH